VVVHGSVHGLIRGFVHVVGCETASANVDAHAEGEDAVELVAAAVESEVEAAVAGAATEVEVPSATSEQE
jgi:hypothetical protein